MNLILKDSSISTRLFLGFSIILLVVITIIIVSDNNSNTIITSENLIVQTHKVLTELKDVEARLIDLETGQRGYIITGKLKYLEPYHNSMMVIDNKIDYLISLTSDNASQAKRIDILKEMIDNKLSELLNAIELREKSGFEAAKEMIETDDGKIIMEKIRSQISNIRKEELRLLEIRTLKPDQAKKETYKILMGLLVFSIIIIVIIAVWTVHSITKPIKALQDGTVIVGEGNLNHKLGINRKDEIGQLSRSFEAMLLKLTTTMASKNMLVKEIETRKLTEEKLTKTKSELVKNTAQLIESNRTKDKFLSIIAHDLRNPFQSMLGFSRLLIEGFDEFSKERQKKFLKIIHLNLESTFNLLENLLIWSRSQRGSIEYNPEQVNLYQLSKEIINLIQLSAKTKSITLIHEISQDIIAYTDKNMFTAITSNLLTNAIKFTPEEGEIKMVGELKKDDNGNKFVEIIVKDSGTGIPGELQSKLFDSSDSESTMGTANEQGTGLGLKLCKEFVDKHGGKIWVESEVDKGSSFHFTLPCAPNFSF